MPSGNQIPPIPAQEQIFLNEILTNELFRKLLSDPKRNRHAIKGELRRLGITDDDKVLDAIEKINWSDLQDLEDQLGRGVLTPRMG